MVFNKTIEELLEEYKFGQKSVRQLAKENNIPFATLRDKFKKLGGKDYTSLRSGEGSINAVLQEIMRDTLNYSEAELTLIQEWYTQNYTRIINNKGVTVYTENKLRQLENTTVSLNENLISSIRSTF